MAVRGNGSLLAGTHRTAANDIMVMLGGGALIPVVSLDEVEISDDLQAALDDCDYEMIDQIWDRKMTNIIQRAISKHGAKAVYEAANARMSRDHSASVGLNVESLADADEIGSAA